MRAQGVPPSRVVMHVSPQQMGSWLGNVFTQPVIARTIVQALVVWSSRLGIDVLQWIEIQSHVSCGSFTLRCSGLMSKMMRCEPD